MGSLFIHSKLRRCQKKKVCFILILAFILCSSPISSKAEDLKIHFIDVGEGDSIFIQTPKDNAILIDTGNLITGFKVAEYLKKNDINSLEYLIFTHPDLDHIGGAFLILQMMKTMRIYDNGQDLTERKMTKSSQIYRWYEELVRASNNYNTLKAGDKIVLDGVTLKVLWPPKQFIFSDFNANSLVIMLRYKDFKCLLTGDLTIPAEREIIKEKIDLKADVLKVGHHGAKDASSKEFLDAVSPEISIISVNENNIWGYPSENVSQRLKISHSKVYRTDRNGNINVKVNEKSEIKVSTEH